MEKDYNKYGSAAKQAAEIGENPVDSWEQAVSTYFTSESSKQKGCPRNAFLGLCEVGLIKGIKDGVYLKSKRENLNKKYAITAVEILNEIPSFTQKELWDKVREKLALGEKKHNSQMDVVLALWQNNLIKKNTF
ncbi:hypothetical protein SAMN05444344_3054 [Tenacibaculum mesophilum]|uniref:Uncharacterized protein n=1 Tax=Tenacibaculum mesophilum TaxID=104268 RepID=A0ABM7CER2_9FLAO|nr:hypothetical protein [Tenacibaculum mesophilum]AZJ32253.1 hypothetical protein D6200_06640 [Tenacibaculum mesophilum]QFS27508.1 hypothetical protein F9Y86_03495 [Tenacibaculum mesophilum]SHG19045.1 hypothetical protein SAMN05444344_3054 [Tenacibaculum mesophilum]